MSESGEGVVFPSAHLAIDGARVRRLASDLPSDLRAAIDCTYFEGLSATEIAGRLEVPVGTVKSRLARALDFLRKAIHHLRAETEKGAET